MRKTYSHPFKSARSGRSHTKRRTHAKTFRKSLKHNIKADLQRVLKFQSSATWQHTVRSTQFSKQDRFFKPKIPGQTSAIYTLPTTKSRRQAGMGYGNKEQFSLSTRLNAKYNPSPDNYNIKSKFQINRDKKRGNKFNMPRQTYGYRKVLWNNDMHPQLWTAEQQPGPGTYNGYKQKVELLKKQEWTLRPKLDMFNAKMDNGVPGAGQYHVPKMTLVYPGQHKKIKIGMGLGNKTDFKNKHTLYYPGPGTYTLPTFCDQIKNRYSKLRGNAYNTQQQPKTTRNRRRRRRRRRKRRKVTEPNTARLERIVTPGQEQQETVGFDTPGQL